MAGFEPKVYKLAKCSLSIELEGDSQPLNTVGLVVEYAPATGETRVRFPDGVVKTTKKTSLFGCSGPFLVAILFVHSNNILFPCIPNLPLNEFFYHHSDHHVIQERLEQ